jgi:hypothetical protein
MSSLFSRGGNHRPYVPKFHIIQGCLEADRWTIDKHTCFTSRGHHPAPKLEFHLSLLDNKKWTTVHPLENSPKIHSLEDLDGTQ